jgi:class 3 adenylate cyclase
MRQPAEQRRLLAVLVADIVSYSRLMAENEADTFHRVKDLQASLIIPATDRNRGRIVKWTGDGFLATFDSAVDAVRAAVEIQSGAAAAAAAASDDRRIRFRMGVNAGDVIVVPGDVYGDTVNVAARLETAAPPGGICISRGVRDTVRGKFSVEFEDRGELAVKNIPDPVGAFDVRFDPIAWTMARAESPGKRTRYSPRILAMAGSLVLILAAMAGAVWFFFAASSTQPRSTLRAELAARLASAAPGQSEKLRQDRAREYEAASNHKAQAVSSDPPGTWRATARPTPENAETAALESCQVFFGRPCTLVAVNDAVQPAPREGTWPRRDMPRARYAGMFDPAQLPGSPASVRERADIISYRGASGPKAVAYHPSGGRVFTVAGAATQRAAEEEVLKRCNTDPTRNGADGTCFLYAVSDQVVLPQRRKEPLTAMAPR